MIQSFAYRNPRIASSFPVEFMTGEDVLFGFTRDMNDHGFSAEFGEPVALRTHGKVRLRILHCVLELQADVVHTEGFRAGFAFTFATDRERAFVLAIVQALTKAAEHADAGSAGAY